MLLRVLNGKARVLSSKYHTLTIVSRQESPLPRKPPPTSPSEVASSLWRHGGSEPDHIHDYPLIMDNSQVTKELIKNIQIRNGEESRTRDQFLILPSATYHCKAKLVQGALALTLRNAGADC